MKGTSDKHSHAHHAGGHGLTVPSSSIVVVFLLLLALCMAALRGKHGRLSGCFAPSCANPQHKLWCSCDSSPLHTASPRIVRAVQGNEWRLNQHQKICEDCISKLVNKPAYRQLFTTVKNTACVLNCTRYTRTPLLVKI